MAETSTPRFKPRPLSPHLQIWRLTLTMAMSIVHRVTGAALYFGILLVAWWLLAAGSGPNAYATFEGFIGSWFGRLVLFGYTWALVHHMLGGLRHLIWDTGAALEKHTASRIAWANVAGPVVLTVLIWVAGYAARGF